MSDEQGYDGGQRVIWRAAQLLRSRESNHIRLTFRRPRSQKLTPPPIGISHGIEVGEGADVRPVLVPGALGDHAGAGHVVEDTVAPPAAARAARIVAVPVELVALDESEDGVDGDRARRGVFAHVDRVRGHGGLLAPDIEHPVERRPALGDHVERNGAAALEPEEHSPVEDRGGTRGLILGPAEEDDVGDEGVQVGGVEAVAVDDTQGHEWEIVYCVGAGEQGRGGWEGFCSPGGTWSTEEYFGAPRRRRMGRGECRRRASDTAEDCNVL